MTAGTRRNGTSKSGTSGPVTSSLLGAPVGQAEEARDVVGYGRFDGYDYAPCDDTSAYANVGFYGHEELTVQAARAAQAGSAARTSGAEAGTEGHGPEPSRNVGRYAGRHGSGRAKAAANRGARDKATGSKTTRKRVGRIVPVAAVAATLAAGTAAAYSLSSGGQPQAGHLNASMALHGAVASAQASGAGNANEVASAPIEVATATASSAARAPRHAKSAPSSPPAAPSYLPKHAAQTSAAVAMTRAAAPAATPATPATLATTTAKTTAATTLSCNTGSGLLPANTTAIVSFLLANGYSDNAAAGIAGNIYQESKGDPESVGTGGGGLIGWTPLPSGFVTGNTTADLQTQLAQILTYNQIWSQFLPALNSAASPADAADIYVTDFERAGIPAASTREASAQAVASACGI